MSVHISNTGLLLKGTSPKIQMKGNKIKNKEAKHTKH